MSELEQFTKRARTEAARCGLTDAEIAEASGALSETDAIRAVSAGKGSVLLLGPPGTGKTLAATRWLIKPVFALSAWSTLSDDWIPPTVQVHKWPYLFRTAKSLSRVQQYDEKAVEPLFAARRLVVDDLGQEYLDKSGFLVALIDEIVSERHRRRLSTVMTANLTAEEFEQRYGKRVVDRIAATGELVICQGASLRRRAPADRAVPPLVTAEALIERRTELAALAAKHAADDRARLEQRERDLENYRRIGRVELPEPKSPPREWMTDAETEARKAEIARQLTAWRAANPEAAQSGPTS